ncbi:TRAP transporter substrate-binding protein [Desulfoluna sp.]|uniref:TRAP transporter substrate-binding protein n=1 Tax=Desulfoluna sp. TaxID=2045199 RepID=UPI00263875CF|nr:TRAP transporter substrate-binding protein DctP [Desulfoluna sp.]
MESLFQKKPRNIQAVRALLFLLFMAFGWPCPPAGAEAVTLTYATNTAPVGLRGMAEKAFVDEIERLGKGKIHILTFWEQSFLKDKEILEGVKDGTVDMGHVNINYYPGRLVINGAITLMQQGPATYANRMWVYDTLYQEIPQLNAEFERYHQKIVYTYSVLPIAGAFTQPVSSLGDFKNRRVRASSRWLLKVLEGAGAIPVSLPWADTYMALKTNALEGIYTNIDAIHRIKLDTVAPHILVFKEFWNPVPFHITINMDTWNRLPEEVQKIIQTASANSKQAFAVLYESMLDETIAAQKKAGCQVAFAQKEDIDTWLTLPEVTTIKGLWAQEVSPQMPKIKARRILEKIEAIVAEGIQRDPNPI